MLGYQKSWCSLIFLQLGLLDVLQLQYKNSFFYSKGVVHKLPLEEEGGT